MTNLSILELGGVRQNSDRRTALTEALDLACGAALENQYPALDPLAMTSPPQITGCTSMPAGNSITLSPGKYCDRTWSGDIVLEPGVYVMTAQPQSAAKADDDDDWGR